MSVEAVERFWISLADHVVLLVVTMPLVGAGLVRLMKPSGAEPVYFTGLVNVWLTAGLALVMLARFEPGKPDASEFSTKMTSSLSWMADWQSPASGSSLQSGAVQTGDSQAQSKTGPWRPVGPDLRLSVGVNRYSLWFLVLTVATTLAAFRSISPDDSRLVPKLSWLLLTESAMLGTFAAQDVILMAMCCQVSTLGLFFLIGQGGDPKRREAARRFFRTQIVSGMLILFALVGAAICHWWMLATVDAESADLSFSLRRIVAEVPRLAFETEAARDLWASVSPWLFVSLCAGLLLRLPMPPFHHWWYRVAEHADSRVVAMMAVGYVPFSFSTTIRILIPLFPEHVSQIAPRLFLLAFLAVLYLSASALAIQCPRRKLLTAGMVSSCVAFGAASFGDEASIQGGLLLTVSSCGALALLNLYWAASAEGTVNTAREPSTADQWVRRLTIMLALASLSVIPLSGSFWGEVMILQSIFRRDASAAFWLIVAALLVAVSLRHYWQLIVPKNDSSGDAGDGSVQSPVSGGRVVPLMPIAFVLAAAALVPQWVLGKPQPAITNEAEASALQDDSIPQASDKLPKPLSLAESALNAE